MVIYTKVSSVPEVTTDYLRQEYIGKRFDFVKTDILNKYKGQINEVKILFYTIPKHYRYYSNMNRVLIVVGSVGEVRDIIRG